MNAKIEKTKHSLIEALSRLVQAEDLNEITVSRLCREAGINRTTFYKYYSVPMDVLMEYTRELFEKVIYSDSAPKKTVYEYMLLLCQTVYSNRNLLAIYGGTNGNLTQMFYQILMKRSDSLVFMTDPVNNFIAGGVASCIMTWVLLGCSEPPEQIARKLTGFISKIAPQK
ncbi:MAG: TetR/AcrR family transcriptional regulator [Faecousia sp.]